MLISGCAGKSVPRPNESDALSSRMSADTRKKRMQKRTKMTYCFRFHEFMTSGEMEPNISKNELKDKALDMIRVIS